jgi:phage terminase large subunit-like protein
VLSVYVAGNEIGTKELDETTRTYLFQPQEPTSGNVEIRLSNTMKAMYLKQIEIGFEKIEDSEEGIENISVDQYSNSAKILMDGQLYIINNEHIYTILGTQIK